MFLIADVHLGNHSIYGGRTVGGVNERFLAGFNVFQEALKVPGELFILGDLFDTAEPTMAHLGMVADALAARQYRTHILFGNHDWGTFNAYDHALAPLSGTRGVVIHADPEVVLVDNLRVFVCPYPHHLLDQSPNHVDVALAHAGISDSTTPAFLLREKVLPIADVMAWQKTHQVKAMLSGDWHTRKVWSDGMEVTSGSDLRGLTTVQVGALVPTGWDNPGFGYGSVWSVTKADSLQVKLHATLRGPRFLRTASLQDAEAFVDKCEAFGYTPYVKFDGHVENPLCKYFKSDTRAVTTSDKVTSAAAQVRSQDKIESAILSQLGKVPETHRSDVQRVIVDTIRGSK